MVAPLDALQLKVTLPLPVVGPGLLVEPGLGLVGVPGAARAFSNLDERRKLTVDGAVVLSSLARTALLENGFLVELMPD